MLLLMLPILPRQLIFKLMSMNNVMEAQPTSAMRLELQAKNVALPTDGELTTLSTTFNAWLTSAFYEAGGRADALSWVDLYNVLDDDSSGFITFDEVRSCLAPRTVSLLGAHSLLSLSQAWMVRITSCCTRRRGSA